MAVPNTTTFTLQNVVDEVNPTTDDLVDCYADANTAYFDTWYNAYQFTTLYGFRNYNGVSYLSFYQVYVTESGDIHIEATFNFNPSYVSINNGVNWYVMAGSGYVFENCPAGSYNIKIKDYKQELSWTGNPLVIEDDWWLPSRDEMDAMHDNLYIYSVGNLQSYSYWTSSEWDANYSWFLDMSTGNSFHDATKDMQAIFRPSRKFNTGSSTSYALRDTGPAGGWIYYIENPSPGVYTYYEAAKYDYTITSFWSNIINVAVTGTNTSIGSGENNSSLIIGQAGHTSSAAKKCLDMIG